MSLWREGGFVSIARFVCVCLWGIFARAFIRGACVYLGVFASLFLMSQIIAKK